MQDLTGKTVVVTGAGSGIGRALAGAFSRAGSRLALADVNAAGLEETVAGLGRSSDDVRSSLVDVADRAAVLAFAAETSEAFGAVDVVVNNAGIAHDGVDVVDFDPEAFARVMDVNFYGVVHGTQAFLPALIARPEAAVVNVSSVFGLAGIARQSAYCASKFAVRGFTESLRMELQASAPHVVATSVHPGGIRTGIATSSIPASPHRTAQEHADDAARFDRLLRISPDVAAARIVSGVQQKRTRVLIGGDARVFDSATRLLPGRYSRVLGAPARRLGLIQAPPPPVR